MTSSGSIISTILRHDNKVTSYKLALLRAINDVVLAYPDVGLHSQPVAIPLRLLAEFWLAYYWPFCNPAAPIAQGPRSLRAGGQASDMAFRSALIAFRLRWETVTGPSKPSDGFYLINELRLSRKRSLYPPELLAAYHDTLAVIAQTIRMPIRYAGEGQWTVFARPARARTLAGVDAVPGTQPDDPCVVISAGLWATFRALSLWIEALCIHEWCLFTERVTPWQGAPVDRGQVYRLLTDRPDNRRPLTWERNQISLLLLEGKTFTCPWTARTITSRDQYAIDHLVPIAVYPINELWNLVPADPTFNSQTKRDRMPSPGRLDAARPHLALAYRQYQSSRPLAQALAEDVAVRFSTRTMDTLRYGEEVASVVTGFIEHLATSRNLARFR